MELLTSSGYGPDANGEKVFILERDVNHEGLKILGVYATTAAAIEGANEVMKHSDKYINFKRVYHLDGSKAKWVDNFAGITLRIVEWDIQGTRSDRL